MSINHQETSQAIQAHKESLTQIIASRLSEPSTSNSNNTEYNKRELSLRDIRFHLANLSEAMAASSPILFTDYTGWLNILFESLKFSPGMAEKTLEAMQAVLFEHFQDAPESQALVEEYISAGIACLHQAPKPVPIFINQNLPLGGLARDYLEAVLHGDRQTASQLILDAVAGGENVKNIYLHILQPVQYEIGHLWHTQQISVAQEHFCTFVTESIMSQIFKHNHTQHLNHRLVAICVGSNTHEIGLRMVTDFFELSGWDTYYLGSKSSIDSVLQTLMERRADILAISAALTVHVSEVAELIARVRASEAGKHVKILVGGYPFIISENLWQFVHADGFGRDAQHALDVATTLMET
ncbi:MAG: cobalamin-dependent protein [Chloroflexota bacterium]